jgi:hypothetical protein
MKTTTKLFNPAIETDVLAYRIVSKFKMCLALDEWHIKSTESEKILGLFPPIADEIDLAVNVLKGLGYNVKNENSYYGGPFCSIIYNP